MESLSHTHTRLGIEFGNSLNKKEIHKLTFSHNVSNGCGNMEISIIPSLTQCNQWLLYLKQLKEDWWWVVVLDRSEVRNLWRL